MKITGVYPAMKIVKEGNMSGLDMYVSQGDKVKITRFDDVVIEGQFMDMEWGTDEEMDDMLYLKLDDGTVFSIGMSHVKDIID